MAKNNNNIKTVSMLLRVGLSFVFIYAGVSSLRHPLVWEGFLPTFLTNHLLPSMLIKIFAVYELLLGVWLISGTYLKYSALLCTLTLAGIIISNPGQLFTTFRDVGLAFMSLSLFFFER